MDKTLEGKIIALWEDEDESVEVVDGGNWNSNGKYQNRTVIVKYNGKYYSIVETRSGSYHTDYEYYDEIVHEVEPYQVTITKYRKVKE